MDADQPNFFAGPYLERCTEIREDVALLATLRGDPHVQYLIARGTAHLLHIEPEPRIDFHGTGHPLLSALLSSIDESRHVFLGRFRGRPTVMVELPPEGVFAIEETRFQELRPLAPVLQGDEAGLLAYARALTVWRARTRFCGVCGAPTVPIRAGHCMRCARTECAAEFFPRIDPAIIVLVSDGERALLGRQPSWPPGRYSTLAGFVEPGESLEDAVAREVLEETGVSATQVRYHSSQPWPFPSSLMLGFHARARAGSPVQVTGELEDARWFTREEVRSGSILLPPPHAIAHRLISLWLEGDAGTART